MSHHDEAERDLDIEESHETDPLSVFEGDLDELTDSGGLFPLRQGPVAARLRRGAPAVGAFLAVVALWELLTRAFNVEAFVLPRPSVIVERFFSTSGVIWPNGLNTLIEAVGGLVAGVSFGVLVALATVRWAAVREGLMPFAVAANSVPIIALAPITNAWFSITSPVSKMAVVAVVCFFPVMINTARGLIEVDPAEVELMRSYAASPSEVMRRVRVPHALPYFFSALKVVSVLSIIAAIVAEYFGGPQDVLGQYIINRANLFLYPDAWAAILVASILGIALYTVVLIAERLVMPWHVSFRTPDR
jgi:NitT/TauT family transport system permease protein